MEISKDGDLLVVQGYVSNEVDSLGGVTMTGQFQNRWF